VFPLVVAQGAVREMGLHVLANFIRRPGPFCGIMCAASPMAVVPGLWRRCIAVRHADVGFSFQEPFPRVVLGDLEVGCQDVFPHCFCIRAVDATFKRRGRVLGVRMAVQVRWRVPLTAHVRAPCGRINRCGTGSDTTNGIFLLRGTYLKNLGGSARERGGDIGDEVFGGHEHLVMGLSLHYVVEGLVVGTP